MISCSQLHSLLRYKKIAFFTNFIFLHDDIAQICVVMHGLHQKPLLFSFKIEMIMSPLRVIEIGWFYFAKVWQSHFIKLNLDFNCGVVSHHISEKQRKKKFHVSSICNIKLFCKEFVKWVKYLRNGASYQDRCWTNVLLSTCSILYITIGDTTYFM